MGTSNAITHKVKCIGFRDTSTDVIRWRSYIQQGMKRWSLGGDTSTDGSLYQPIMKYICRDIQRTQTWVLPTLSHTKLNALALEIPRQMSLGGEVIFNRA